MKNKIINLFGDSNPEKNDAPMYSSLLEQFMSRFSSDFRRLEYLEDIFELSIHAWNLGNLSSVLTGLEAEQLLADLPERMAFEGLIERMVEEKVKNFSAYTNFILDYELKDVNGEKVLKVITQKSEDYLASFAPEDQFTEDDFSENFINRSAIVLKPLSPFIDWINQLPDDFTIDGIEENNIYLVNENIEDVEAWLRKKFDWLFQMELEGWWTNKKNWPQRRTYKMFKQWFEISLSSMVFDMERTPIRKE